MKAIWSPRALQQLDQVITIIARDRPSVAEHWLTTLNECIAHIIKFPLYGRVVPEKRREDLRQIQHPPYRVIYRVDPDRIVILSLRHGRRDWDPRDVELGR